MQTYEILVQNRAIRANSKDMTLVRTSVGIDQVHVLFDSAEWLDFPVTITFAQGDELITQSLLTTSLDNSEWVAEATVTVPYEVIDMTGPIRVTIQGTDADGRHIITAKGSPLSVDEAGDVVIGRQPSDTPSVDQWQQAYSQAMAAANAAQSVADNFEGRMDTIIAEMEERILAALGGTPIATRENLGCVIVGNNVDVDENGVISVDIPETAGDLTPEQATAIVNLSRLAYYAFDTEFNSNGELQNNVVLKRASLPIATTEQIGGIKVGSGLSIDANGVLSVSTQESGA